MSSWCFVLFTRKHASFHEALPLVILNYFVSLVNISLLALLFGDFYFLPKNIEQTEGTFLAIIVKARYTSRETVHLQWLPSHFVPDGQT